MILTRQQKLFRGNGSAPNARAIADATIRALSPAAWYRNATDVVSSGGFASIWADYASTDKGLVLPRVNVNYASTPGAGTAVAITGDRTYIVKAMAKDYTPSGNNGFVCKANGATNDYQLYFLTTGEVIAPVWDSGGTQRTFRSTTGVLGSVVSDGESVWIKVTIDADNGAGGSTGKFYTSTDYDADAGSGTWTQLGPDSVVAATWTGRDTASSVLYFGLDAPGFSWALDGVIHRIQVYSDLTQTTKVLDADFSSQAIGAGSFTESSSNAATVTINTSGAAPAHIGKARDLLQGTGTNQPAYAAGVFTFDGADNFMKASAFTLAQPEWAVIVVTPVAWTTNDYIVDGNSVVTMGLFQGNATPDVALTAGGTTDFNSGMVLGERKILSAVWNGASSTIKVNGGTATTGNCGAGNGGGLTLCANGAGSGWANMKVEEVVVFPIAPSAAEESSVVTAINNALTVF